MSDTLTAQRTFVQIGFPKPPVKMGLEANARRYQMDECSVIVGKAPKGWHMSISHPSRNPTWEEVRDARYKLVPNGVTMAMLLPPKEEYVNIHSHCFHLWQTVGDFE